MELYCFYDKEKCELTIQRSRYIEDGWYIVYKENQEKYPWELYEIPQFGGEEHLYDRYNTLYEAICDIKNLT